MTREMSATILKQSSLERTFETRWKQFEGPDYEPEHKFHPRRKWRFDIAWPGCKVAIELQGGTWTNGGHNRGKGYENDCHKLMAATLMGWRVFWLTTTMIDNDPAGALCPIIQFIRDNEVW